MIQITININGEKLWILKRIECVFRGHDWNQWFTLGAGGGTSDYRKCDYEQCKQCDKIRKPLGVKS